MSQEGGAEQGEADASGAPPPSEEPVSASVLAAAAPPSSPPAAADDPPSLTKPVHIRKEESPFSFKHFLRRDLSLPTASTSYESTGAKPKIYSNTVHPSPARNSGSQDYRKDGKSRDSWAGPVNTSSDSSIELMLNSGSASESKNAFIDIDHCDLNSFKRSHTSSDALGMPSLPDFVQDHLLLEQTYLGSNGPLTVDFDNLPDFALNSNTTYDNVQSNRSRDYCDLNASSNHHSSRITNCKSVPLDLPSFAEDQNESNEGIGGRCRPSPLDLPSNLSLDLTDSLNHSNQRDNDSVRVPFPLDLTGNENPTGGEPLRLPDFLPAQAGANSPNVTSNVAPNRDELAEERRLRIAAERELRAALQNAAVLRRELQAARNAEQSARRELLEARASTARMARELRGVGRAGGSASGQVASASSQMSHSSPSSEDDKRNMTDENGGKLKQQVSQLKDELSTARREIEDLRGNRRGVARSLHHATNTAENSLRELLNGLEQLRGLAFTLDPP